MQAGSWRVLGLMSGSSLDGLDLCLARFWESDAGWAYEIEASHTLPYDAPLQERLAVAHKASALELVELDQALATLWSEAVVSFLAGRSAPLLISSHGHTIFHDPQAGFSTQIGNAQRLAAHTQLTVVHDFRSADLALGGQGAPLVPIGDRLLFGAFGACLNLGGIANISFEVASKRIAYDLAYCNTVLNTLSHWEGKAYDAGGQLASSGKPIPDFLAAASAMAFYRQAPPRSLGRSGFETEVEPLLNRFRTAGAADLLHSWCIHLAQLISTELQKHAVQGPVLVTGGGAHHAFLMEQLRAHGVALHLPDPQTIDQKEALIFGFLGLLRYLRRPNVWKEVTGSSADHTAGALIELFP